MAKNKVYATDDEIQRAMNMYDISDKEYQNVCVAYMYGESLQEADKTRETLTETEVANANDWMMTNGLPSRMKQEYYRDSVSKRRSIEEKHGLSPIQAITARDRFDDLVKVKGGGYDLESDKGKEAVCKLYSRLEQNNLTSSAQEKMKILDAMAEHAGLEFNMTNRTAYMQPNALVVPRFELVETTKEQDFSDAVASIPSTDEQLEQ